VRAGVVSILAQDVRNRFNTELNSDWFKVAAAVHSKFKVMWCHRMRRE